VSNLSDLLPAGASGKTIEAVATANITSKAPVILNSAGTVTPISETSTTRAIPEGAKAEILGTENKYAAIAYDPVSGKAICTWRNNEGADEYGRLSVGTVSGTTITWNTSVVFDSTNLANEYHTVAFDPNTTNSFVIHYGRSGSTWDIAGTVSGTSASVGTSVRVRTATAQGLAPTLAWNPNQAGEYAAIYKDDGSSANNIYVYIGTVTGNSISQGATNLLAASAHDGCGIAWNKGVNDELAVIWRTHGNQYVYVCRGTVSGASIAYGTISVLSSSNNGFMPNISFDDNVTGSFVWQYFSSTDTESKSGAGTLSGDTWTIGATQVTPDSDSSNLVYLSPIHFSQTTAGVGAGCWYGTNGSTYGARAAAFSVSGTTLTWGTSSVIDTGDSPVATSPRMSFNPQDAGSFITCNGETSAAGYDTNTYLSRIAISSSNLTAANFVGIADAAISSSATGTIVVQGGTATGVSLDPYFSLGTPVVYETATTYYTASTYDSTNDKTVICYRDNGNGGAGTAIVGTVSGTTISYGTAVVFDSGSTNQMSATFDTNSGKIVIVYEDADASQQGTAVVGTVSGTGISFGTPVVFKGSETGGPPVVTYDSTAQKVVVVYNVNSTTNKGHAIVGTVSGTSISFGTEVIFKNDIYNSQFGVAYDANADRTVITYQKNGGNGTAIVGTVSGTGISFGTEVVYNSADSTGNNAVYDPDSQKVVIAFVTVGVGKGVVGTVSGTGISFGALATFAASDVAGGLTNSNPIAYDTAQDKVVLVYEDTTANTLYANTGTVSGTSISFGTATTLTTNNTGYAVVSYDPDVQRSVFAYADGGSSDHGTAIVGTLSGDLATGSKYYVTTTGGYSTSAGSPSVSAGLAISTTSLLLNGDS
jgi:hypothetical protein